MDQHSSPGVNRTWRGAHRRINFASGYEDEAIDKDDDEEE